MNEITTLLIEYRECCRSLWNLHCLSKSARGGWDLVDRFREVTAILFECLVVDPIGENLSRSEKELTRPYIKIIPDGSRPIMIARPSNDGVNYWDDPVNRVDSLGADLQFMEFFDWQELAIREFRYYKVIIRRFDQHPDRVGRRALIEVVQASAEIII